MLELSVRASSPAVRCAYCHGPLAGGAARGCPRCGSSLHEPCWGEARRCPTLGCAPRPRSACRPRVRVVLGRRRAFWIDPASVSSGVFGALVWFAAAQALPAFTKMFEETGICLPASTELLCRVPTCCWWALGFIALLGSPLKDRWLAQPTRDWLNLVHVLLSIGVGLLLAYVLFLPLIGCYPEKL